MKIERLPIFSFLAKLEDQPGREPQIVFIGSESVGVQIVDLNQADRNSGCQVSVYATANREGASNARLSAPDAHMISRFAVKEVAEKIHLSPGKPKLGTNEKIIKMQVGTGVSANVSHHTEGSKQAVADRNIPSVQVRFIGETDNFTVKPEIGITAKHFQPRNLLHG